MNEGIRVSMVSLGCARNLVDSEVLLGHVVEEGLTVTREGEDADVVVVNTCGFVEDAKQESVDALLAACDLKQAGNLKGVIAVGCLAQRYADELAAEIPQLDAVLGISDYTGIPKVIRSLVNGSERRWVATVDGGKPKAARSDVNRLLLTPKSYSYLRISEGCDHKCTFCAIPSMRGRNRSKPIDVLVEEAKNLAGRGVRELCLIAEDSTAYGLDTHRKRLIHELVARVADVDGIDWVRLMYAYPHTVDSALTDVMREHPSVVPYLDIPVQHVSGPMLRAMKRGVSSEQVKGILHRLRDEVPGIAVRTTFIVGFPGETEADYEELRAFVDEYRFERMGVFTYSREETTPAFDMPDQVPEDVAAARRDELMTMQRRVVIERNRGLIGECLPVLVDGKDPDGSGCWVGRTTADAPEVDCLVEFVDGAEVATGDLVDAEIVGFDEYDLVARLRSPAGDGRGEGAS